MALEDSKTQSMSQPPLEITTVPSYESFRQTKDEEESGEVFGVNAEVNYRTMTWQHATIVFLKVIFATGVLSIPATLHTLGAVPGTLVVIGFQALNTYCAIVQGQFRERYKRCHSLPDMVEIIGGPWLRELSGVLFMIVWTIATASGLELVSEALNALSDHAICTNYFSLVAMFMIGTIAGVRRFEKMAWVSSVGFVSVFSGILIVVIGVTLRSRPASAPQTGPFDLGFYAVGSPSFGAGMVAVMNVFFSGAGTSAFIPVISEMRNPKDYNKAVYTCMGFVTACYVSFSLVVYRWCGQWVASPSLGSAGPLLKKVSFGVALFGCCVSAGLTGHVAVKYIFVRTLRNSPHLQKNSFVHWGTWLAYVTSVVIASFLISSGIPIFAYINALAGSIGFGPLALMLPAALWIYLHQDYWRAGGIWRPTQYLLHCLLAVFGLFVTVGGAYGTVQQIVQAYQDGTIGSAFSCADNSNSS